MSEVQHEAAGDFLALGFLAVQRGVVDVAIGIAVIQRPARRAVAVMTGPETIRLSTMSVVLEVVATRGRCRRTPSWVVAATRLTAPATAFLPKQDGLRSAQHFDALLDRGRACATGGRGRGRCRPGRVLTDCSKPWFRPEPMPRM